MRVILGQDRPRPQHLMMQEREDIMHELHSLDGGTEAT
jgi:hypothetical protein